MAIRAAASSQAKLRRSSKPSAKPTAFVIPDDLRPDRRQAIVLAAEKLFAQRGYHAVSLRQIAEEAAVPLALVGYYYGQKHELFHAIFERWSSTIEQRVEALALVSRDPQSPRALTQIIHAFVDPVLRLRASDQGEHYALLGIDANALTING